MREFDERGGRIRGGEDAIGRAAGVFGGAQVGLQAGERLLCKETHEIPALMSALGDALGQMAQEIDLLEKVYSPAMTPEGQRPGTIGAAQPAQTQIGSALAAHLQSLASLNERLRGFAARCQL